MSKIKNKYRVFQQIKILFNFLNIEILFTGGEKKELNI